MSTKGVSGSSPRVSVVIPCFNGEAFVGAAIESAFGQTHPDIEVIVVDDGSADNSLEAIRRHPEAICIAQANGGVSAARNAGLARATGDFVIFLDCDDILRPDCVAIGLAALRRHPQASFTFGRPQLIDAAGQPIETRQNPGPAWLDYATGLSPRIPCPPALALFRTPLVRSLGGFDVTIRYGEDYDFYLRHLHIAPAWRHGAIVAGYRRHEANATRCMSVFLNGVMEVLETERMRIGTDTELLAEWHAGRRNWQRFFGRMMPRELLGTLLDGNLRATAKACRTILNYAPGTLEGMIGVPQRRDPERAATPEAPHLSMAGIQPRSAG